MMCYSYSVGEKFGTQYAELTDEELAVKAAGDSGAAAELISRVLPPIRALAHSIEPSLSEDLLQEGLMAALAAIDRYDPSRGRAVTFFVQCAKNRMLTEVGRISPIGGGEEVIEELADENADAGGDERFDALYAAIGSCLTPLERGVVSLYLAGLSYRETAAELSVSEKSVDNAMQRARRKLREEFEAGHQLF